MKHPTAHARSVCPVACTLDLIGDRWTLLVLRDMHLGKSHFHQFAASPEKIATNILTDRLTRLVQHGLARTHQSPLRAGAQAYALTPKGRSLLPVLQALRDWGLQHLPGTAARLQAPPHPAPQPLPPPPPSPRRRARP